MRHPADAPWLEVILDYESFYDPATGYSLKSRAMDPAQYILDPRFECIGCAVKVDKGPTGWVDGPQVPQYLGDLRSFADREKRPIRAISHQQLFDGAISSWRYGFVADQYVDTLALSRALLGYILKSHALGSTARYLGLGEKGQTILKVAGMRRENIIAAGLWNEYANYSCNDADLCRGIFDKLFPVLPWSEAEIHDLVLRMAIVPRLEIDVGELVAHLSDVQSQKEQLLATAGLDFSTPATAKQSKAVLMSNEKFAELLTTMGITPPRKISPTTGDETWAFAKSDDDFQELREHPDVAVQALVEARLGHKSTLEETRTERLLAISRLTSTYGGGLLPVALKPSGAHTHRLSGDWKLNLQNLPRPSLRRPVPRLRKSVRAPAGHKIVAADSRQIEARMTFTFCEEWSLVEQFENGEDLYANIASKMFGRTITKADVGPRFCGKLLKLSGNYQTGWRKYKHTLSHSSREQTGTAIILSDQEAMVQVDMNRRDMPRVVAMWHYLGNTVIPAMMERTTDFMVGPVRVMFEMIVLPNGMVLHYHNLFRDAATGNWMYFYGGRMKKLYGGKLLENIIQSLARIVVMDAALKLRDPMETINAHLAMQSHDELAYLVPDRYVDYAKQLLTWAMKLRPSWLPRVPVDTECGAGPNYAEVKP